MKGPFFLTEELWYLISVCNCVLHCNPNAQENLDHLSTNVSEQDDRSKLAIEGKIGFYWNLRYESCVFNCDNFLKQWSKQSSETGKDIVRKQTILFQIHTSHILFIFNLLYIGSLIYYSGNRFAFEKL